jgi:molybdopterin-binding protein
MPSYPPVQVAELLGVSADTVRRWCDEGRLEAVRTDGGHRHIDGASLARYLSGQEPAFQPAGMFGQSARNRLTGIVTRVERDGLTAIVEVHAPPHRIISLLTREAVDELDLQPGDLATAVVKATNVIIETPRS